jgi:hypothetical protein
LLEGRDLVVQSGPEAIASGAPSVPASSNRH